MAKEMLNTKEVAEYLNINEKQVYKLIQDKKIPATRITGKWTFPKQLIDAWIIKNAEENISLKGKTTEPGSHIVVMGSHDFCMELLSHELSREFPELSLSVSNAGSFGGLLALSRGICHVACAHLFDPETGTYNVPYLAQHLPDTPVVVINLVYRDLGLIVQRGNPLNIQSVADIERSGARIINRQSGSGTRLFFDAELKRLGIAAERIPGYESEVSTHNEAALAVFGGSADAAAGILSAANMLGLDFVYLTKERFDLIIPKEHISHAAIDALLQVMRSPDFKQKVNAMSGYDTAATGQLIAAT
ncbi:MAG: helix-turn-helix domain-containing protein [Deltaproteobacteria bacterium]|nr:helix-turn-helix domain-containing protein [Deltaproteobacteria bacterium]